MFWTKIAHWSKILELLSGWVKIHEIPHVIFETTSHFFFKLCSWEITLLYFFSWNYILFWRREPIRVPNFRLSISPNLYLDRHLLLKVYKISAKKVQKSCVSWHWRLMQNLKKNRFVVSKLTRIWWIFIRALRGLKNLHFDWDLAWKVCNVWSKKLQRSYLSWHQRVMQNLKKKGLVVWKITWGISQIFTRAIESWDSKFGLLWGTFVPSRTCMSLKFTGELCVITMKKDAKFKKELTGSKQTWGI